MSKEIFIFIFFKLEKQNILLLNYHLYYFYRYFFEYIIINLFSIFYKNIFSVSKRFVVYMSIISNILI